MVPAKQLHLPVRGVSMLSCNLQRLHGHCIPASRDSVLTNSIQSVANMTKLKNNFSPKCFSFYAIIKEKSIKTLMGSTESTQFSQIHILSLHI